MPACPPAGGCGSQTHAVAAARRHGGCGALQVALPPPTARCPGPGGAAGLLPHLALARTIAGGVADAAGAPAGAPAAGGLPARHAHPQRRGRRLRLLHLPHLACVAPEAGGEAPGATAEARRPRRRSVAGLLPWHARCPGAPLLTIPCLLQDKPPRAPKKPASDQPVNEDALWGYVPALDPRGLQRGLLHIGDPARMRRALYKLLTGEKTVVAAVGGSISVGRGSATQVGGCMEAASGGKRSGLCGTQLAVRQRAWPDAHHLQLDPIRPVV